LESAEAIRQPGRNVPGYGYRIESIKKYRQFEGVGPSLQPDVGRSEQRVDITRGRSSPERRISAAKVLV